MQRERKTKTESDSSISPFIRHGSQAAGEEDGPRTYRTVRLLRFPRLAGMVPVSWLVARYLQQWEHKVKTMQNRKRQRRSEIH